MPTDAYRIVPLERPVYGDGMIREANRRLLQVAGIGEDGRYWFAADDPATARRVESYAPGYSALPPDVWVERFYGD